MIKETDASKNDERRVKNKPIPLTHKKKGETHIMGNQGMKNWKLGAFFVISLMLTVGLFVSTAPAHEIPNNIDDVDPGDTPLGNVTITPESVDAGSVTDLTIRYSATGMLADSDATDANGAAAPTFGRIRIGLPAGWGPATDPEIFSERRPQDRDATYLTLAKTGSVVVTDFDEDTVTGTLNGGYVIDIDVTDMRSRSFVALTIRNLSIPNLDAVRGYGAKYQIHRHSYSYNDGS